MEVIIVALFALVLGLAFCFWGYRVFLVLLPIWGFFAGLWLGAQTVTLLFGDAFLASVTGLVVGFVTGVIFAILSYLFYTLGVAIVGGAIGAALVTGFMGLFGLDGFLVVILALIGGIIFAAITVLLNLQKYVIIVLTAVAGANGLLLSVLLILGRVSLEDLQGAGNAIAPVLQDSWFWALGWIILAALGIYWQIKTNRTFVFTKADYAPGWE